MHRRDHAEVVGHDSGKRSTPGVTRRRQSFVIETPRLGVITNLSGPYSEQNQWPDRVVRRFQLESHFKTFGRPPLQGVQVAQPVGKHGTCCEHLGPTYRPLAITGGKCRVHPPEPLSWMAPIPPERPGSTDEVELSIRASNVLRPRERFTEVVLLEEKTGVLDAGTGCRLDA